MILIHPYTQECINEGLDLSTLKHMNKWDNTYCTYTLLEAPQVNVASLECSSHESSSFQIKLKRNTGCFKGNKERK